MSRRIHKISLTPERKVKFTRAGQPISAEAAIVLHPILRAGTYCLRVFRKARPPRSSAKVAGSGMGFVVLAENEALPGALRLAVPLLLSVSITRPVYVMTACNVEGIRMSWKMPCTSCVRLLLACVRSSVMYPIPIGSVSICVKVAETTLKIAAVAVNGF